MPLIRVQKFFTLPLEPDFRRSQVVFARGPFGVGLMTSLKKEDVHDEHPCSGKDAQEQSDGAEPAHVRHELCDHRLDQFSNDRRMNDH